MNPILFYHSSKFTYYFVYINFFTVNRYSAMRDQYLRYAQGLVVMYSITNRSSFEQTQYNNNGYQ